MRLLEGGRGPRTQTSPAAGFPFLGLRNPGSPEHTSTFPLMEPAPGPGGQTPPPAPGGPLGPEKARWAQADLARSGGAGVSWGRPRVNPLACLWRESLPAGQVLFSQLLLPPKTHLPAAARPLLGAALLGAPHRGFVCHVPRWALRLPNTPAGRVCHWSSRGQRSAGHTPDPSHACQGDSPVAWGLSRGSACGHTVSY